MRPNIFTKKGPRSEVLTVPDNCIAIIDRLIEVRRCKGLTQKDLAIAAGLTQSVIARLERKKATPQLDTLLKVATALDCSLEIQPNAKDALFK